MLPGVGMFAFGVLHIAASAPALLAIVTTPAQRATYLAHATIWRDPGPLSSGDILDGPSGRFPDIVGAAAGEAGIACAFVQRGKDLAGHSPKFLCRPD